MTTNDIPAIRKLANRSTGTPWTLIEQKSGDRRILAVIADGHGDMLDHALVAEVPLEPGDDNINDWRNDAEFIAAARQIVPDLADEVEQLRAELTKVAAAIAPTVTINPPSDAARFLHNLYQDWVKTAHERLEQVEQLRAELTRADAQLIAAYRRADGLHEQNAAAQNALRSLSQAYADLKTDNDELAAENARLRQDRDTKADIAKNRAGIITNLGEALNAHAAVVEAAKAVYRADAGSRAALATAVESLPIDPQGTGWTQGDNFHGEKPAVTA